MSQIELINHLASCIPLPSSRKTSSFLDHFATPRRLQIATALAEFVLLAGMEDPLTVLPTDMAFCILDFFDIWEVACLRAVSKEWFSLCSRRMDAVWFVQMKIDIKSFQSKTDIVELVNKRFTGLRSISVSIHGMCTYFASDVGRLLSNAKRRISTLLLHGHNQVFAGPDGDPTNNTLDLDAPPTPFSMVLPTIEGGAFDCLITLVLQFHVSDAQAGAMVGHLPCLRNLSIFPQYAHSVIDDSMLTSHGVSNLISGLPSLTILFLYHCAIMNDSLPACRSGIRRLGLHDIDIADSVLQSLLTHTGADLRTLRLSYCPHLSDASVECIADRCPNIERLMLCSCDCITTACLPHVAQLTNLRDVALGGFAGESLTVSHLDWLQQHRRSFCSLNDYRHELFESEYGGSGFMLVFPFFSFPSTVAEDEVPVDVKAWGALVSKY